ncbi:hypothetical protein D3C73_774810 [compost metagenome]
MSNRLESGVIPARIPMGWTCDIAELDIIGRFRRMDLNRECHLKQLPLFMPIYFRLEINPAVIGIQDHILANG